jgi:ABC-2 type transport system permease protein
MSTDAITAPVMSSERAPELMVARVVARPAARSALLWGAVFALVIVSSVSGYAAAYGTVAERVKFAASLTGNIGIDAIFGLPVRLDTVGGFVAWRALGLVGLVGGIWAILLSTKLIRGEEDAGRWELLLCGATTRRAAAAQALGGMAVAGAVLFAITAGATVAIGRMHDASFSVGASLYFAVVFCALPVLCFVLGAFTSQLAPTRRQAAGLGSVIFGIAFVLRAVANAGTALRFLQWATPLGWLQTLRPFTEPRPFALVLFGATIVVLAWATVRVAGARDLGASALPDRDTAEPRTALLNSQVGLSLRLARPSTIGWTVAVGAFGAVFGVVAKSAGKASEGSAAMRRTIERLGGRGAGATAYLGIAFLVAGMVIAVAAAAFVSATRDEEATGYLDNLLVRPVGRVRWIATRLAVNIGALVLMVCAAAFCAWAAAASQGTGVGFGRLLLAGVNMLPLALFVLGIGTFLHGVVPRFASAGAYAVVAWSFLLELLGSVIHASSWLLDLSVLHHVALAPAVDPRWGAAAVIVGIGCAGALIGVAAFHHRDLATA